MKIQIKIEGRLSEDWAEWFENFEINFEDSYTILSGDVPDHSALHGILNKIRDLNLTLISVNPEPNQTQL